MVRLQRYLPQSPAAKRTGCRNKVAPVLRAHIVLRSGVRKRQAHALKTDEAVRELVLHRLKAANEFAKLLALFRVVHRHLKRTPRRAVRARQQTQPPDQMEIRTERRGPFNHLRGAAGQRHFGQRVHAQRASNGSGATRRSTINQGGTFTLTQHGQHMRGRLRAVHKAQHAE